MTAQAERRAGKKHSRSTFPEQRQRLSNPKTVIQPPSSRPAEFFPCACHIFYVCIRRNKHALTLVGLV